MPTQQLMTHCDTGIAYSLLQLKKPTKSNLHSFGDLTLTLKNQTQYNLKHVKL